MNRSTLALGAIALAFFAQSANAQWQFNNCAATGPTGPTQGACDTEYSGTSLDGEVTLSGGIQTWTVPATGIYRIDVSGAAGGDSIAGDNGTFIGGGGATVAGDFQLMAGEQLTILVGQLGTTPPTEPSDSPLAGGGGGSFVWSATGSELLIAAGGGGGAGDGYTDADANGANGVIAATGSLPGGIDVCVTLAAGGEGWTTANYTCGSYHAGGGAGWNSNGQIYAMDCDSTGTNALSPLNGGIGGNGNNDDEPETGPGGFGGGGGSATECGSTGGGGGGGYTGGAGLGCEAQVDGRGCGPGGGGGGSFNSGANPTGSDGANDRHGEVIITAVMLTELKPVPTLSEWGLLLLVLVLMGGVAIRSRAKLLG